VALIWKITMNKLTPLLLGGLLMFGTVACSDASKTSADAPDNTSGAAKVDNPGKTATTQKDAASQVRQDQIKSDERARKDRGTATGGTATPGEGDIKSLVRDRLETALPSSKLAVDAKDGNVTVSGLVAKQDQLKQIEPLAKQVKGVKTVTVKASVAPSGTK
jgi:hyperosmotically inducible protein